MGEAKRRNTGAAKGEPIRILASLEVKGFSVHGYAIIPTPNLEKSYHDRLIDMMEKKARELGTQHIPIIRCSYLRSDITTVQDFARVQDNFLNSEPDLKDAFADPEGCVVVVALPDMPKSSQIDAVIEGCGDCCTICRKPLALNARTYSGVTRGGVVAVAGECCKSKLARIHGVGIFVANEFASIIPSSTGEPTASYSAKDALLAVGAIEHLIAGYQKRATDTTKRGGVEGIKTRLVLEETSWKTDDAAWFEAHPDRSHRLRKALPGEMEHMFGDRPVTAPPPHHEWQMLVRQVEPGRRARLPVCGGVSAEVPDLEPILHGYFDLVAEAMASSSRRDRLITADDVMRRANRYWDVRADTAGESAPVQSTEPEAS